MTNNYRNNQDIHISETLIIDKLSLWTRKENIMTLVDDDSFIQLSYDADLFQPA